MNLRMIRALFSANFVSLGVVAGTVLIGSASALADAVTEWNETAVACTVTAKQPSTDAVRSMAMVHVAMFEAVNSIEHLAMRPTK